MVMGSLNSHPVTFSFNPSVSLPERLYHAPSFLDTFFQTLNVTLWLITALNMITFIGLLTLPLSEHYSVLNPNNKYNRYLTYIMGVGAISFFIAIGSLILVFNVSADPAFHPNNNPITENIITPHLRLSTQ